MLYSFLLEPEEILGVRHGATLEEIRTAYREKAKKHHPDADGDPWAFRVLSRAHELLTAARVAGRVAEEQARVADPPSPPAAPVRPPEPGDERVRPGVHDRVDDPARLVDVELLFLRYELDDPAEFLMIPPEERNLSCSLNLVWPTRRLGRPYDGPEEPDPYLKVLRSVFARLARKTRPDGSRARDDAGRYVGWLSYPTAAKASEAFQLLHALLREEGFGVDQTTREFLLPRDRT